MATIGLDSIYYSIITDGESGETYATPVKLAKATKADLSVEFSEGTLYADDALCEAVKEFKSAKLTLGVDDLSAAAASALTGATIDQNKVLVHNAEDSAPYVAIGFRAKKSNGNYRYYWLYRGKFGIPSDSLETKGDSIKFAEKSIEGTFMRREKAGDDGSHAWKAQVDADDTGVQTSTISGWFTSVYEPDFTA
ncbi:phage tail protein [Oscillibacter sp. MSJ-2]|uniref:Phage tail protein n=1 Tax=Dysosmobacter acutus TaxID=2841504 RepID=A0ABS6FBS3_9FIRM|nr:major tail protein [Dysosmobacter acutus]MBU5627706.1 phage tail protein [Dysosmobacter acutus]